MSLRVNSLDKTEVIHRPGSRRRVWCCGANRITGSTKGDCFEIIGAVPPSKVKITHTERYVMFQFSPARSEFPGWFAAADLSNLASTNGNKAD